MRKDGYLRSFLPVPSSLLHPCLHRPPLLLLPRLVSHTSGLSDPNLSLLSGDCSRPAYLPRGDSCVSGDVVKYLGSRPGLQIGLEHSGH